MRQLAFTIMTNWRDWRVVRIDTWDEGWDLRVLCFSLRSEPNPPGNGEAK